MGSKGDNGDLVALRAENARLREVMREAWGSLACADMQSLPSDDQIIMGRIREAATMLRMAMRDQKA